MLKKSINNREDIKDRNDKFTKKLWTIYIKKTNLLKRTTSTKTIRVRKKFNIKKNKLLITIASLRIYI